MAALNPTLANLALNIREGYAGEKYVRIDMGEVRALRTDAARLIHQRLCGWINPGRTGRIKIDTLCGYVWPDQAATQKMQWKRRYRVRRALRELRAFERPWTVNEYSRGRFEIGRPEPPPENPNAP